MKDRDSETFSTGPQNGPGKVEFDPGKGISLINNAGEFLMEIHGNEARIKLTTRAGRHAMRMWAYTQVGEGAGYDWIAKAVLDYVGREELLNAED